MNRSVGLPRQHPGLGSLDRQPADAKAELEIFRMRNEVEVKIKLEADELDPIRRRIADLGFKQISPRTREENILFDLASGDLKMSGCALRLRRYGSKNLVTYKGKVQDDPHLKVREEVETLVDDFDSMRRILEAVGLKPGFEYGKFREKYLLQRPEENIEICLDETPFGFYAEIEGSREAIVEIAEKLGWGKERFVRKNYVDIYREQGHCELSKGE